MNKKKTNKGTDQTEGHLMIIQPSDTANSSRHKINYNFGFLHQKCSEPVASSASIFQRTLLLLGHPTVKVELTEEHMQNAMTMAASAFSLHTFGESNMRTSRIKDNWIEQYAVALMKETLSRIRGKFSEVPVPGGGHIATDAERLLNEATSEKYELKDLLMEACGGQRRAELEEGVEWQR